jgi:hypothetical protein
VCDIIHDMAEKTETNPRGAGRPAKVDNQAVILAHKVMDVNKKLDRGLSKIGDNYPDIAQTAIDIALGKGTINVMTANGPRIMERNPDVPMLRHLLSVGIEMIDKTGEGPDSPSQQILKNMQAKVLQLTQVKIDNLTIANRDTEQPVAGDYR